MERDLGKDEGKFADLRERDGDGERGTQRGFEDERDEERGERFADKDDAEGGEVGGRPGFAIKGLRRGW